MDNYNFRKIQLIKQIDKLKSAQSTLPPQGQKWIKTQELIIDIIAFVDASEVANETGYKFTLSESPVRLGSDLKKYIG